MKSYLTKCVACRQTTSRQYARKNAGKCKACVTGTPREPNYGAGERRHEAHARLLEAGHTAYAREEGHYDCGD
jgi:hypothetical protein